LEPLDTEILSRFAEYQDIVLKMMDRIDALDSFNYHERIRLYFQQLKYWRTVLDDIQPDIVVFSVIPHMIFDYILYVLCKQRNIRTLMFESTPMRGLVFVMSDFDKRSQAEKLYHRLLENNLPKHIKLSPKTEIYLQKLKGTYKDLPDYTRRAYKEKLPQVKSSTSDKNVLQKLVDLKNYPKYVQKQKRIWLNFLQPPRNYLKQRNQKVEESSMSFIDYQLFRWESKKKMRNLETYYHQLAQDVDLSQPYVYVALSYQPERTSSPMGSFFVHQYLMVDLIAKSLPKGWHVYVKEHPTQFTPSKYFRSQSGRFKFMYDDISALTNVSLVPMAVNSFDLIDSAQAVAVVTGTTGWEAIHRGKPVLVFGFPWYRGCEGTFHVDTREKCEAALRKIYNGYQIDSQKRRLFVYALEQTGIEAFVEPHLRVASISDGENAKRLADALQKI
jgi:hypothetical protein